MRDWNKHQCLMFFLCFFFLSAGLSQRVYAVQSIAMGIDQQLQITGVVKDTNGEPMIGVTVMVKERGPVPSQTLTASIAYPYLETRAY